MKSNPPTGVTSVSGDSRISKWKLKYVQKLKYIHIKNNCTVCKKIYSANKASFWYVTVGAVWGFKFPLYVKVVSDCYLFPKLRRIFRPFSRITWPYLDYFLVIRDIKGGGENYNAMKNKLKGEARVTMLWKINLNRVLSEGIHQLSLSMSVGRPIPCEGKKIDRNIL